MLVLATTFALKRMLIIEELRSAMMALDPSVIKQCQVVAYKAIQDVNMRVALIDDEASLWSHQKA